ncbi:tripartite motif-containing protein 2-like [Branchiostoma floridae]|uniref:Tripartite motif-containing protein 2-like n=1 Tax=Branchiostoma floridae TaxID=7739 RepID=A0A9J7HT99_BRAFL|nr:tripartite motif-containing protein 2-like [Branchiostoma floridae]
MFSAEGKAVSTFSIPTAWARGVAVSPTSGNILIVENENQSVMTFTPSGELVHSFHSDHFSSCYGIAEANDGRILAVDYAEHCVAMFESDGTFIRNIGKRGDGEGEFYRPFFIAMTKSDGFVVSDSYNHRLQTFNKDGHFERAFGQRGETNADFELPLGVGVGGRGEIVVADRDNHRLQVVDTNGSHVTTIANDDGRLDSPANIAVTYDGHVYVINGKDKSVDKFKYN